jgi:hypothetical protein
LTQEFRASSAAGRVATRTRNVDSQGDVKSSYPQARQWMDQWLTVQRCNCYNSFAQSKKLD